MSDAKWTNVAMTLSRGSRIFKWGLQTQKKGQKAIIWPNFPENCMTMKKIGPKLRTKIIYLDPSLIFEPQPYGLSFSSANVNGLKLWSTANVSTAWQRYIVTLWLLILAFLSHVLFNMEMSIFLFCQI